MLRLDSRVLSALSVIATALVFALFSQSAEADERYKFLSKTCVPELGFFEISASAIWNIGMYMRHDRNRETLESENGLYAEGQGNISCDIGPEVIVEYASTVPRASGMCGSGTHSVVNISIDGVLVAENLIFDDDCYSAGVRKISVQAQGGFFSLGADMHPGPGISGPREVFSDSFLVRLQDGVFLTSRKQQLPITMEAIKQRMLELGR